MRGEGEGLYPSIEPYLAGHLDVGDGHSIYWELCGNPEGKPVVFLHGGPGSGCGPVHRRLFDPQRYKVLLFDQRGCGRSRPTASLEANTTWDLVADIERLREANGTDRWMVFGGSWGATLALAYAQSHPSRVSELVLRGVFTGRRRELDWFYRGGAGALFPAEWERFLEPLSASQRTDPVAAYRSLLLHEDRDVRARAARAWTDWESSTVAMRATRPGPSHGPVGDTTIAFARIENHYFVHDLWMEEGQLIAKAGSLASIPGIIVQGRYDVVTPPVTAFDLHRAWPGSELRMVEDAGHAFSEPGTLRELVRATDRFAS